MILRTFKQSLKYVPLVIWTILVIFPFMVIIFNSFKSDLEYTTTTLFQLPKSFLNIENFVRAFIKGRFAVGFKNSLILVVFGCLGTVLLGTTTAYAIQRFEFKLKKVIMGAYALSVMIPGVTLTISIYSMLRAIHTTGTYFAPILLYIGAGVVEIYIYLQFLDQIPKSLDESAMIDGASYFRIFRTIIFPLLTPATATLVILKAINIYNDVFTQYIYMSKPKLNTVITALVAFSSQLVSASNLLSAGVLIIMLPTIIMFLVFQKYIFAGITLGSVKD